MPRQHPVFALFSCAVFLTVAPACSSSDSGTPATSSDTGTTGDSITDTGSKSDTAEGGSGTTHKDHGFVLDYVSRKPVAGITVTESGVSATSDATGAYSLDVAADTPVQMVLSGGEYAKTYIAEVMLGQDYERTLPIPLLALYHIGTSSFPGFDATRGVVYVVARATGTCASVDGGTVTINSPTDAKLSYFTSKLPDADRKEFKYEDDDTPVAAVYNVPAGQQIDITITHPTCKQAAFPTTVKGITYTGKVTVEAGDANTVSIYYLQ